MRLTEQTQEKSSGFSMNQLIILTLGVFIVGFLVGIIVYILSEMDANITNQEASDALNDTMYAITEITDWLPIIIIVGIAVVLLGMIFFIAIFAKKFSRD